MTISNYSELKDAISSWMDRNDFSGSTPDEFVSLAEARLNRVLDSVETNATLTGVVNSREIDVSSLAIIAPLTLYVKDPAVSMEFQPIEKAAGGFAYSDTSGFPSTWELDGATIKFDVPLDQAYPCRFRYVGRFALSDAAPTNALLTEHPDIYLCASIVWGGLFTADDAIVQRYAQPLEAFMREHRLLAERSRRGRLNVDPALSRIGRWGYGYGVWS